MNGQNQFFFVCIFFLLQACAPKTTPRQSANAATATANPNEGYSLYVANCTTAGCHSNPPTFLNTSTTYPTPTPTPYNNTTTTQAQSRALSAVDLYSINNAIQTRPAMQFLQTRINQIQITSISLYLTQQKTATTYNPYPSTMLGTDGTALYNQYCSSCHGASTSVQAKLSRASALKIRTAVLLQSQMRTAALQNLVLPQNQAQLDAIVNFLATK